MYDRELGAILAKLEAMHEDIIELKVSDKELRGRIIKLERAASYGKGALAVVIVIGGYMSKLVFTLMKSIGGA